MLNCLGYEVTQAVKHSMLQRYEQVKEELVHSSIETVPFKQGYLQAYQDMLSVFTKETDD